MEFGCPLMKVDVMAGVFFSHLGGYLYSILWKCCAILTGYYTLPGQQILIKGPAKENTKFGLFNGASYTVVACTTPEIGALKDRPFIPEYR